MAKQKPGVYDRVLECAKEEFLSRGVSGRIPARPSPRRRAPAPGPSTPDSGTRRACSSAIVEPVVDEFRAMFREIQESFHQLDDETQKAEMGRYTARHQRRPAGLHL